MISHDEAAVLTAALRDAAGGDPTRLDAARAIAERVFAETAPLPAVPDDGRPPVRLVVHTEINRGGTDYMEERVEVPRAQWEAMTASQRGAYCDALAEEAAVERCGSGFYVLEPDHETYTP